MIIAEAAANMLLLGKAGQAYGGGGWWFVENPERSPLLGIFFTVNRSFFMSLFFMISGYFLPASYDRKGPLDFLKDRFLRLGVPLLVFFLLVIPVMTYAYYINFRGYGPLPFWSYFINVYFGAGDKPADWSSPNWPDMQFAHLWFVEHLLLFAICYTLWRIVWKRPVEKSRSDTKPPGHLAILIFAFALAAVTFVVRLWYPIDKWIGFLGFIQVAFADVPRDLSFFIIGVIAYRRNWFLKLPSATGRTWLWVGVFAAALCYILRPIGIFPFSGGGLSWQSYVYPVWESLLCNGFCIGFLVLFREKFNIQGTLEKTLAANTYAVYLFHLPVVVLLNYAILNITLHPLIKFILVSLAGVPLTFLISNYIRRLPLARSIL